MENLWTLISPYFTKIMAIAIVIILTYTITKGLTKLLKHILKNVETIYTTRIINIVRLSSYIVASIIIIAILAPEAQMLTGLIFLICAVLIIMFIDILRNIGNEMYVRSRNIVNRGDWIEIDGISIKVLDFDTAGILGETQKLEKVFIPYTKLLNSIVINRTTPFGLLIRIFVDVPQSYGIDGARNSIIEALNVVKEDLASEPDVTYLGSRGNMFNFVIEFHIINYRKLTKVVSLIEKEIKNKLPEAFVKI